MNKERFLRYLKEVSLKFHEWCISEEVKSDDVNEKYIQRQKGKVSYIKQLISIIEGGMFDEN